MLLPRMSPFVFVGPCRKVAIRILVKKRTDARRSDCIETLAFGHPSRKSTCLFIKWYNARPSSPLTSRHSKAK